MAGENQFGADIELSDDIDAAALLFGEAQGRIVVTAAADQADDVVAEASRMTVPARIIGRVGERAGNFVVSAAAGVTIDLPIESLHEVYATAIPRLMGRTAAD
jgi:phosphoribosylformylglycinamidine synthase